MDDNLLGARPQAAARVHKRRAGHILFHQKVVRKIIFVIATVGHRLAHRYARREIAHKIGVGVVIFIGHKFLLQRRRIARVFGLARSGGSGRGRRRLRGISGRRGTGFKERTERTLSLRILFRLAALLRLLGLLLRIVRAEEIREQIAALFRRGIHRGKSLVTQIVHGAKHRAHHRGAQNGASHAQQRALAVPRLALCILCSIVAIVFHPEILQNSLIACRTTLWTATISFLFQSQEYFAPNFF